LYPRAQNLIEAGHPEIPEKSIFLLSDCMG
jgi:hypothetical protein